MGLFKDIRDTQHQAKELSRNSPGTGARLSGMSQQMAALTTNLESATTAAASAGIADAAQMQVQVQVQVLTLAQATGYVHGDPIVEVGVLIVAVGGVPIPATQTTVVPAAQLHRLVPGARLPARVDTSDPSAFAIDWASQP